MSVVDRWLDVLLAKPLRHLSQTPAKLLNRYIGPGATVLDAGCGTGFYSLGMADLVGTSGRIVAVDTQIGVIDELRKQAEHKGLASRIDARVCDDEQLAVGDLAGRIDFALAVYVVHHAANPARLLDDIYAALKPGGLLLVIEPKHHASLTEREAVHTTARRTGFTVAGHPKLRRDWAVEFVKPRPG